jgi:hypothetical protein
MCPRADLVEAKGGSFMLARRIDIVPSHQATEGAAAEREAVRPDDSIDELPSMASDAAGPGFAGAPGQTREAGAALCFLGSPVRRPNRRVERNEKVQQ